MVQLNSRPATQRTAAEVLAGAPTSGVSSDLFATGFEPFDSALGGGIRSGALLLLGGLPGIGKTIAALQWARNFARAGHTALFVSYEHDDNSLLARLLLLEAAETSRFGADERRLLLSKAAHGAISFDEAAGLDPGIAKTKDRFEAYASHIWLTRATSHTGLREITELLDDVPDDTVLFVDYLQKVPVDGVRTNAERVIRASEGLKDLALQRRIPVVAVVAADSEGLTKRRLRTHHFRGSSALAFEADVVVILNDKFNAVSKRHSSFDPVRAERFKSQVVFTIEKNRDGPAPVDLEFLKDFEHYRFIPDGNYVGERLVDEHFLTE